MLWDPDGWVQMWICPELRLLQTDEQRKRAVKQAKTSIMSHRWFNLYIVLYLLAALAGYKLMSVVLNPPGVIHLVLYTIGVSVAYVLIFSRLYGGLLKRIIRAELRKEGIWLCIHCGYDIRGLSESRCPECGRWFQPFGDDDA